MLIYFVVCYFRCSASPQKSISVNMNFFGSVNEEVCTWKFTIHLTITFQGYHVYYYLVGWCRETIKRNSVHRSNVHRSSDPTVFSKLSIPHFYRYAVDDDMVVSWPGYSLPPCS